MKAKTEVCATYCLHEDEAYLPVSMASVKGLPILALVSDVAWNGSAGHWEACRSSAERAGAEVILGSWGDELSHRKAVMEAAKERGFTHALIVDGDEVIEPSLLDDMLKVAEAGLAERVYVEMDTYWKSSEHVIRPRERLTPCMMIDLNIAYPTGVREFEGGRPLMMPSEYGVMHHLSYCGPDSRISRKLETFSHRDELVPNWYQNVWLGWDGNKLMRNLHPTHPSAYGFAERIQPSEILTACMEKRPVTVIDAPIKAKSSVSIVIPLHGGEEDIRHCLRSLEKCCDLIHELVIVDNASPDSAADIVQKAIRDEEFKIGNASLIRNDDNRGFGAACNQGVEATTGDVVLFLNSDTVVPRAGLCALLEALNSSGSIAAAGPLTNNAGHLQQIAPTYTSLERLDLFAEDWAGLAPSIENTIAVQDVDMLVGFCLAVKRDVLEEVGGFDERFGLGTFEDNDLCYHMRRAGYRLVIASRAYVHHRGSQTLQRMEIDVEALLAENYRKFTAKWRDDLETGFASNLSGLSAEPIRFDAAKHPDIRRKQAQAMARRADTSLCMIAKDEERCLRDALESARPFFREMIVVDTGSTDRTKQIAQESGARVFDFPWVDSFAAARNESLRHAQGRWVFWMDADDTIPWRTGEMLQAATVNTPPEIYGLVVPVQFVSPDGTRVDHLKLFRNLPGVEFEGRIHEQIIPSLRRLGGEIGRLDAFVLHTNYDTSPEGQAKKLARDRRLLKLELKERPSDPFVLFNLGMTEHYEANHEAAVRWLRNSIKRSGPLDSQLRKAYALLAVSLRALGRLDESWTVIQDGLTRLPEDPELHFQAGHLLTSMNKLQEAKEHYEKAADADISDHFSSVDQGILGFKTYHNLGGVCHAIGDYPSTRQWLGKAVEQAPDYLPSAFELFDASLEEGDFKTAKRMLAVVRQVDGANGNFHRMREKYVSAVSP